MTFLGQALSHYVHILIFYTLVGVVCLTFETRKDQIVTNWIGTWGKMMPKIALVYENLGISACVCLFLLSNNQGKRKVN